MSYADPFGLCPEDKGGDGKTTALSDCPEGTAGYDEFRNPPGLETPLFDPVAFGSGFLAGFFRGLLARFGLSFIESAGTGTAATVLKGTIPDVVPQNLPQQLALDAARSGTGAQRIMGQLADAPRLVANYGQGQWVKMQYVLRGKLGNITVHWFRNLTTGENVDNKFANVAIEYLK